MKSSIFENSKNSFLDNVNARDYVHLDKVSAIYQSLKSSVQKPLKMILLYGKPGTGKSMFLEKLYHDLSESQKIYLYKTPLLDESEFFKTLATDLFGISYQGELNFTQFMLILNDNKLEETPVIFLDEAQLYSSVLMEKIRLLSDTRKIKFVITLHKTNQEDLIAKEHFQTRIWESIELENSSMSELKYLPQIIFITIIITISSYYILPYSIKTIKNIINIVPSDILKNQNTKTLTQNKKIIIENNTSIINKKTAKDDKSLQNIAKVKTINHYKI